MADHGIVCSRIKDILDHRQTVLIFDAHNHSEEPLVVGDGLCLVGHPNSPRGAAAVVISVTQHRLHDILDADLPKLGCDRETFLASWDRTNPEAPQATNPEVTRVEFRPGFPDGSIRRDPEDIPMPPTPRERGILEIAQKAALDDIQAAADAEIFSQPDKA